MSDALPPVKEWPDYDVNPQGADPLLQDINAPYNKVSDTSTSLGI